MTVAAFLHAVTGEQKSATYKVPVLVGAGGFLIVWAVACVSIVLR